MLNNLMFNIQARYLLIKMWVAGDVSYNFKTKKWSLGRNQGSEQKIK